MQVSKQKIEIILARSGKKKKDVVVKSGVTYQHLSTILRRGTCEPHVAGRIARALGVEIEEIIADDQR